MFTSLIPTLKKLRSKDCEFGIEVYFTANLGLNCSTVTGFVGNNIKLKLIHAHRNTEKEIKLKKKTKTKSGIQIHT